MGSDASTWPRPWRERARSFGSAKLGSAQRSKSYAFPSAKSGLVRGYRLLMGLRVDWPQITAGPSQEQGSLMTKHRIYTTSFASVYLHYVAKAEKKGRTKAEVDSIISWLTGYSPTELEGQIAKRTDFETFFADAPQMNLARALITGVVCGVRLEDIEEPTMREIRYLDKLVDELAKGKAMEKILRTG